MMNLPAGPIEGPSIRLEPYAPVLKDAVRAALDCDPDAWNLFATSGQGEHFERWWSTSTHQMERGSRMAYAIRDKASGRVLGSTSFLDIRPAHRGLEIGSTFLHPAARSARTNPEAKRLMLAHAFDAGAVRVELVTDLRNLRSQAAIAKLGAVREGVLRNERITWTGHIRDSVLYSITDAEWPDVRDRLDARLAGLAP